MRHPATELIDHYSTVKNLNASPLTGWHVGMPLLSGHDFWTLKKRIRDALSAVRRGYDFVDVDQFDDEQREQATELVQKLMDEIEDAMEELEVCQYNLGPEECREAKLYLPVQTCTEKIEEKSHYHPTA